MTLSEIYKENSDKDSDIDDYRDYIINNDYQEIFIDDDWWDNPIGSEEGSGGFVGEGVPIKDSNYIIVALILIYWFYKRIKITMINRKRYE